MEIYHANVELQVHPNFNEYGLCAIIEAMIIRGLDALALAGKNESIYSKVKELTLESWPCSTIDDKGIALPFAKFLFDAVEYDTKEGINVLTVGYSGSEPNKSIREIIDHGLENDALVILCHPYVDNFRTNKTGDISPYLEDELERLCREYLGEIALEWNACCVPWIRRIFKSVLSIFTRNRGYSDVNARADELSSKYPSDECNLPLIADTDLNARNEFQLMAMGTARMKMDIEGITAADALKSIKKNIFSCNYQNMRNYVSFGHFLGNCLHKS